ncbi:hypothetical protein [Curtobacterium ammoniigenes]|uniref:hypothetical protein n=1 Tax=Curtobacterium ammoniigenes TaxID=395387 RepID=UPI000A9190C9|nr:hypothetical protein [Curtobacterium ammoniigenes]
MTYSQPDPAEEAATPEAPEQPDTDADLEEAGSSEAALEVHPEDVPTGDDKPGA